jgi:hypothetical protein
MTNKYLYLTLLAVLGFKVDASGQKSEGGAPRLVVSIAIDQLRSDYLEAFAPLYLPDGFKRLLGEGLVYQNATYPFTPVDRASAIAAIGTGVTPYYNSIVGERWLNRETLRPVNCVDDEKHGGLQTTLTASPSQLGTSTIGDELKVATGGKGLVFAIAPERDAAVLAGGHAANGAFWIDDSNGEWCSSKYYFDTLPAWLTAYNGMHSPAKTIQETVWEPSNYLVGNFSYFMQTGMQKPFKHNFTGSQRYTLYKASALVNADVTELAKQCIASNGLGIDRVTDLLCLTYYAGNFNHRTVTECQIELQDTYVRLDQELSRLINHIEQQIGKERVLFVITSTGHTDEESADYEKYRIPTGTFYMNRTANLMNMYFGALWGNGKYVEAHFHNHIFLNHRLLEVKKVSMAEATSRAQEFLVQFSGVRNVYTSLQLLTGNNENLYKTRNGFNPERCGDIIIETAPGWRLIDEDTQENQLTRASFVPFPIIFFGAGTRADHVTLPVTTDRIAPTIARAIRIRAPNACSAEPLP